MKTALPTPAEILQARARALARPQHAPPAAGKMLEVVEFRLAHERYAVEQALVQTICPLASLTPLPCTPAFLLGIINLRGQALPVIDIKRFFDLPQAGITDLHVVIVVRAGEIELGILADMVAGVRAVPLADMQASLPTLTGIRAQYLHGVTPDHVVVLDAARLLSDPQIQVNQEVET